jgi:hypothetical protein
VAFCVFHPNEESIGNCQNCNKSLCFQDKIGYRKIVTGGISMLGRESQRRFASFNRELCPICYADAITEDNVGLRFKLFVLGLIAGVLTVYSISYHYFLLLGFGGSIIAIVALPMIIKYRMIQKARMRGNLLSINSPSND